jgi:hypothetical protein
VHAKKEEINETFMQRIGVNVEKIEDKRHECHEKVWSMMYKAVSLNKVNEDCEKLFN